MLSAFEKQKSDRPVTRQPIGVGPRDLTTTMKLNHLSFPSTDVEATSAFFEKHLGCTASVFGTSRLLKRPGFDIVIEDASDIAVDWPRNFHLGFELPTSTTSGAFMIASRQQACRWRRK